MKKYPTFFFLLAFLIAISSMLAGCGNSNSGASSASAQKKVVRIGYQKSGPLFIVKSLGTLDKKLNKLGYKVEWKEFQDGTSLIEALNVGSIDIGRTGNTPPIFSQASAANFKYVAAGKSKFEGSGILIQKNSSIKSVKDLKGKKVAFAKGSSSHYLLLKALELAGLTQDDIKPVYLSPGDARIAFDQKKVDAWVVWDPYTSATEVNSEANLLINGEGITTDRDFFIASNSFWKNQQSLLDTIMDEVGNSMDWANQNHEDLIQLLSKALKLDEESVRKAVNRRVFGVEDMTNDIIKEQQTIADLFYKEKIIPKKVSIKDAMPIKR